MKSHSFEKCEIVLGSRSSSESQQSGNSESRRLDRGKSVDFLESRSPVGTASDQANLDFAREKGDLTRQHPGADVGQHLCVCSMQDSLNEVFLMKLKYFLEHNGLR